MDIKYIILTSFLLYVLSFISCQCDSDIYGDNLTLDVPISTYPSIDTFIVGDTLWIEASFDKEVNVRNNSSPIYLDNFVFFTEFIISEISDTIENFDVDINLIELVGQIEFLDLTFGASYPIHYKEFEDKYMFKAGIILYSGGLFYSRFSSSSSIFEYYNHPAVYKCDNNRRSEIRVYYSNQSTSLSNYENLFLTTKVDYLLELIDYQRYKDFGGHTFYVKP